MKIDTYIDFDKKTKKVKFNVSIAKVDIFHNVKGNIEKSSKCFMFAHDRTPRNIETQVRLILKDEPDYIGHTILDIENEILVSKIPLSKLLDYLERED